MTPTPTVRIIWATRGRSWGFRFLLDGGFSDPLPEFERALTGLSDDNAAITGTGMEPVGVRFPDPLGRRDASGRVIPHEFVVYGDLAIHIVSVEQAQTILWPKVAAVYGAVWDADEPPSAENVFHAIA